MNERRGGSRTNSDKLLAFNGLLMLIYKFLHVKIVLTLSTRSIKEKQYYRTKRALQVSMRNIKVSAYVCI